MSEQPKHWKPYLQYLERFGERNRGERIPATSDEAREEQYWETRRRNEALKDYQKPPKETA